MRRHTNIRPHLLFAIFFTCGISILFMWNLEMRETLLRGILPILQLGNWRIGSAQNNEEDGEKSRIADIKIKELREETDTLRRLLGIKEEVKIKSHVAHIVLFTEELNREALILGEGSEAGIEVGDIALDSEKFVVGTVREVGQNYSKISLASNSAETYEVGLLPVHTNALARGMGNRTIRVELIPANFILRKGDLIALSGFGNEIFLLAEIVQEEPGGGAALKKARALLLSHPEKLREVIVVEGKRARVK